MARDCTGRIQRRGFENKQNNCLNCEHNKSLPKETNTIRYGSENTSLTYDKFFCKEKEKEMFIKFKPIGDITGGTYVFSWLDAQAALAYMTGNKVECRCENWKESHLRHLHNI
jgi:hypothetical protein